MWGLGGSHTQESVSPWSCSASTLYADMFTNLETLTHSAGIFGGFITQACSLSSHQRWDWKFQASKFSFISLKCLDAKITHKNEKPAFEEKLVSGKVRHFQMHGLHSSILLPPLIWKDICTPMFIAALYIIAKTWNLNVHGQMNGWRYGTYIQCNITQPQKGMNLSQF